MSDIQMILDELHLERGTPERLAVERALRKRLRDQITGLQSGVAGNAARPDLGAKAAAQAELRAVRHAGEFRFAAADGSTPGSAPQEPSSSERQSEEIGIFETTLGTARFLAEGDTVILELPSDVTATQVIIANKSYPLKPSVSEGNHFRVEGLAGRVALQFTLNHRDDPEKFPLSWE